MKSNIYFTAGPSELYPTVNKHLETAISEQIGSMSHRGEAFQILFDGMKSKLKNLLNIPQEHKIYLMSSANECWEKILQNTVENNSFHFVNGAFGKRFFEISAELQKKPEKSEAPMGEGFDFGKIKISTRAETVCFTHNESSTGVALDLGGIYELKKTYSDKLFAMDVVSSIPYIDIDYSLIDMVYFSVQKGFGLPAGLAILIVSPAAFEKSLYLEKKGICTGSYHRFSTLEKFALKGQTPETPNVLDIYLLDKVLDDMAEKTIDTIRKETDTKAKILYGFFNKNTGYELFVKKEADRSRTVVVVKPPDQSTCLAELKKNGLIVGKGYGPFKSTHLRIANFPAHSVADTKKLVKILEKQL